MLSSLLSTFFYYQCFINNKICMTYKWKKKKKKNINNVHSVRQMHMMNSCLMYKSWKITNARNFELQFLGSPRGNKFYITCIKQGIVWWRNFFFPTLLLTNFLICTHLSHHRSTMYIHLSNLEPMYEGKT
jgi:hypothetical protein